MSLDISTADVELIARPHEQVTRLRVFHDGVEVTPEEGVPISSGSVTANFNSRVTRSADIQVPIEYFPHNADDLLSPYQAVIRIESGPRRADGTPVLFPLFTGRVYEASIDGDGKVDIRADDLAADVIAFRFEQPQSSNPSISILQQIQQLISEAINNPVFGEDTVIDAGCPSLIWDEDRGQALDDLATAVQGRWFCRGDGSFVVRGYSYWKRGNTVDAILSDGYLFSPNPGTLISATKTITRDATANSITVVSERTDGTNPIVKRRRDTVAGSPTYFGGPFGKVSQILKPQTPITDAEADSLAVQQLAASLSLTEQWSVTTPNQYYLEPGDLVFLEYRGYNSVQVIDSWNISLVPGQAMSISTRSAFTAAEAPE